MPRLAKANRRGVKPKPLHTSVRRYARAVLVGALLAYGILALGLFFNQESLIFPGHSGQGTAEARFTPTGGTTLVPLSAGRERLVGLYGPALTEAGAPYRDAKHRPTLLYFYGNGTQLSDCRKTLDYLCRLGVNVLIPEYAGYGLSTGAAGEAGCYSAADAAYDYLTQTRHVPAEQLIVTGGSLGGAVAIDLAARKPVAALAAFNTFTSMSDMAGVLFPWMPSGFLLRHRFESAQKIHQVHVPVFLASGDADTFIPPTMSARLAAAAGGPVTRLLVRGAEHGSLPMNGTPEFHAALKAFVARVKPLPFGTAADSQRVTSVRGENQPQHQ